MSYLSQLQNPIHDNSDLDLISKQLEQTETEDAKIKELVFESLKKGIKKLKQLTLN
ncbi:hypothetical protein [Winogradskyella marincola]|uniref:Uncharacterized protein n=1 Tax=Winogradskyella marincola TaxID=3037795 RepID=A0ABT6G2C6_9FLAO|nr:hypothetical protein [Winogradskyella sp. YYF002]MDG4716200.1 hypothetical protein [Winogradskyella sp. YYF002]